MLQIRSVFVALISSLNRFKDLSDLQGSIIRREHSVEDSGGPVMCPMVQRGVINMAQVQLGFAVQVI
ncbi:hypothetical protein GWI33_010249 [Rhynchophorus ferrugineus]|uniref:Uncharacterized protein n=1 Tax=Rhynchophorus ferrugineus TaxID=354439 RepID=A0A834MJR4_RHYFE|nr:hypothetical protein GWI33_010249 [Rhynchophorus ferrugineus]